MKALMKTTKDPSQRDGFQSDAFRNKRVAFSNIFIPSRDDSISFSMRLFALFIFFCRFGPLSLFFPILNCSLSRAIFVVNT
jgi:hypothetical protein